MMNKVAVITGSSQGIGAGLVTAYREIGYSVAAASRSSGDSHDPEVMTVRGNAAEPDANYGAVTGVSLRGFVEFSRNTIAAMLSRDGGGHLVNLSTSVVDYANSQIPAALASLTKGGLSAVTTALAIEYAARDIRVNTVALGVVRTPIHAPETHDSLAAMHPLGRLGEISDVADAIVYLENAAFVTGEIPHVDGGQSAGH